MSPHEITETEEQTEVESYPKKVVKTTKVVTPPINESHPQKAYQTKKAIFRSYQVIWYILGIIEILLIFRFVLKLLGANPASGFTQMIYSFSAPFAVPFIGVTRASVSGGSVFEWTTIIAMVVYAVVAWGITELFQLVKPVNPQEVEQTVDNQ